MLGQSGKNNSLGEFVCKKYKRIQDNYFEGSDFSKIDILEKEKKLFRMERGMNRFALVDQLMSLRASGCVDMAIHNYD